VSDERVEHKVEEFEAHKLEHPRSESGPEQVDLERAETKIEVEDDDFEGHKLETHQVEKVQDV